jgi:endonuclease VIII
VAEGDTILRAARRIEAALDGGTVEASAPNPRGRSARIEQLDGRVFERASAHGKHLLLHFGELVLHSHLGMSGSWHTYRRGEPWRKPVGAAWAVLSTDRAEAVQFGGPTLRLLPASSVRRDPVLARLGPDILAPEFDAEEIAHSLASVPDRSLGDALLDQHLVAGIGNIFKSEACFAARLDPWQRVAGVPAEQLRHLARAAHDLMLAAVEDGRQDRAVYKRTGRPCPRCGTPIRARGQGDANRTTYWCPSCQVAAQASTA